MVQMHKRQQGPRGEGPRGRLRCRCCTGFTLLELILAITVTAIISVTLFASLRIAFDVRENAEDRLAGRVAARVTLDLIALDLAAAPAPTGRIAGPFVGSNERMGISRDADTLTFITAAIALPAQSDLGDLRSIELALVDDPINTDTRMLVRYVTSNPLSTTTPEPTAQILARGVISFNDAISMAATGAMNGTRPTKKMRYPTPSNSPWSSSPSSRMSPPTRLTKTTTSQSSALSNCPQHPSPRAQAMAARVDCSASNSRASTKTTAHTMQTTRTHNPTPRRAEQARGMSSSARHTGRERGAAFIVALLVTTVLASLVVVFAHDMRTQALSATHHAAALEARHAARGVIEAVRGDLAQDLAAGEVPRLNDMPAAGGTVGGCLYWIIGPDVKNDTAHAYGLVGEGSKVNINRAPAAMLVELPRMTDDLAAAITDWRDEDTDTTPGGAESDYYLTRSVPYSAKDGAFESLGELALVRGFDDELIYGEDANRSGRLDPTEDDGDLYGVEDNADGSLDMGFDALATVYSIEPNLSIDGEDRINIQQPTQQLAALLNEVVDDERFSQLAATINANRPYASVLDFHIRNELTEDEFEQMHDKLKIGNGEQRTGLIDVYTASAQVLNTIPSMEPGDGEAIVGARPVLAQDEQPGNIAWIIDVLGEEKATVVAGRLTHRSVQFTVDVVAVTADGRGFCRLRVVIDTTPTMEDAGTLPEIVFVQDLTALGWPMDQDILDQLQAGVDPQHVAQQYGAE